MKRNLILLALALLVASCGKDAHFLTDRAYRHEVHADYLDRMERFPMLGLRLDTLAAPEREAMEFLYAYMPLNDLADYPPEFFLDQVRLAFRARGEMPWGKAVPEDVFCHFVLVYRVNNEDLDTARMVFYEALRDRVKGLSMAEAALEVNHWCHEHVAYRASDARTSAPLATMRTSLGRCGEESTFAVTALRAVGIPARQCYTPRWAHCDDNHAWVEVYIADSNRWCFLGACEPDPRLDMGWFSVPSTRCMMVHSKAFGKYRGDEEVVLRTGLYSELNLLSHYAPTRRVTVTVLDEEGRPLEGARVKFKLYNYAEYYTLSTQATDARGRASLTTGLGDLLVWATAQTENGDRGSERFDFAKIDVRKDSALTLTLTSHHSPLTTLEIVPPAAGEPKVVATPEEQAANARRLAYEDSLRAAYVATFHSDSPSPFVRKSEGNWREIERFIELYPGQEPFLATFSDKDLRDITCATLESFLDYGDEGFPGEVFDKGLLPARVSNELVRPYRHQGLAFNGMTADEIAHWVADSIAIDDTSNYFGCPISPMGVYRLRCADRHSRDIFFVAACRAAGVPAYLDGATNTLYAWNGTQWQTVDLNGQSQASSQAPLSALTLTYRGNDPAKPVYWPHFTLARLENGDLRTFDFEDDPRMEWRTVNGVRRTATLMLEPGVYCLSTGNRYPDGSVRSRLEFFELKAGEQVSKEVVILPLIERGEALGRVDPQLELFDGVELWDYASASGMLYINLGPYSEPSKHLVVELRGLQREMRQWGGMTFMVGPTGIGMADWHLANTDLAYRKGELEQRVVEALKMERVEYPLVALIDSAGCIRYSSTGYKIGAVEQVLKAAGQRH